MTLDSVRSSLCSVDIAIVALIIVSVVAGVTMQDPKDVLLSVGSGLVGYLSRGNNVQS